MILGLITADLRYNRLETTRSLLATLGTPVYWVADLPLRLRDWGDKYLQSPLALAEENERLHRANLILQGRPPSTRRTCTAPGGPPAPGRPVTSSPWCCPSSAATPRRCCARPESP